MKKHCKIKEKSLRLASGLLSIERMRALPIRLHVRTDLHLCRKIWHLTTGLAIVLVYLATGMAVSTAVVTLSCILGIALMVETARLRIPAFNEKMVRIWAPFMRRHEVHRMSTVPSYILASIFALGVFPKTVAILSILYLAIGDPVASLFGILYGDRSIRLTEGKTLVGTMAGVLTCVVITYVYLKSMNFPDSNAVLLSVVGGLAGGTAELIPVEVDDNFMIPVASGFALWLAFLILGI